MGNFATIQFRSMNEAEALSSEAVLASGEPLHITDTNGLIMGDGVTPVQSLTPISGGAGGTGPTGPTGPQGPTGASGDGTLPLSTRSAGYEDSDVTIVNGDLGSMLVMEPTTVRSISFPAGINTDATVAALVGVTNLGTANLTFPGSSVSAITLGTWQRGTRSYQAAGSTTVTSATVSVDSTFSGATDLGLLVFVASAHDVTVGSRTITATYNGVSMTQLIAPTSVNEQSRPCITVFHLENPAAGANNLVVTFGDACRSYVIDAVPTNGFSTFEDANGASYIPNGGTHTETVTATGDNRFAMAFLAVQGHDTLPHSSGVGTQLRSGESGTANVASDVAYSIYAVGDLDSTSAAFNMSFGDDGFSAASIALIPAPGGGGVTFYPNSTPTNLPPGGTYMFMFIGDTDKVVVAGDVAT